MSDKSIDAWQIMRIQAEFTKGFDTFNEVGPSVSVFGSARTPNTDYWYQESEKFGKLIVEAGMGVITGGGPGIMEAANKGACSVDPSKSIGVGIELPFEAGMNPYVDLGIECRYFFTRKVLFAKYAQAFVVFPGGMGTMDELFEVMTLAQTGHAPEFPILLVGKKYWSGLVDWLQETVAATGRMSQKDFDLFRIVDTAEEAVEKLVEHNAKYRKEDTTNF